MAKTTDELVDEILNGTFTASNFTGDEHFNLGSLFPSLNAKINRMTPAQRVAHIAGLHAMVTGMQKNMSMINSQNPMGASSVNTDREMSNASADYTLIVERQSNNIAEPLYVPLFGAVEAGAGAAYKTFLQPFLSYMGNPSAIAVSFVNNYQMQIAYTVGANTDNVLVYLKGTTSNYINLIELLKAGDSNSDIMFKLMQVIINDPSQTDQSLSAFWDYTISVGSLAGSGFTKTNQFDPQTRINPLWQYKDRVPIIMPEQTINNRYAIVVACPNLSGTNKMKVSLGLFKSNK